MNRRPFVRKGFSCHAGYIPLVFLAAAFLTATLWYIALHGLVRKLPVPNYSRRDIFYKNGGGRHHADATHCHPQIALLFLARGELPTEPLWEMWLRDAEGLRPWKQQLQQLGVSTPEAEREPLQQQLGRELLPALAVNVTERNSECWANGGVAVQNNPLTHAHAKAAVRELPRARRGGAAALRGQQLFTVYVHTHPKHPGFPEGSMFRGREVGGRVEVQLAQHSVLEAERLLFRTALSDPRNAKFVLLSESCVPLRPPALIYTQLLLEPASRVDACAGKPEEQLDLYRWSERMATPALQRSSWRKSAQWVVLNAKHAALVAQDQHVDAMFSSFCATKPICRRPRKAHVCVSDESYIPTLLAVYGLDNETDCTGWGTYADWSRPYWHPKEFEPTDVSLQLLRTARDAASCSWAGPLQLARALFPHADLPLSPPARPARAAPADWQRLVLPGTCPLFARKFGLAAVHQLLLSEAASSCHGLALLNRTCSAEDLA